MMPRRRLLRATLILAAALAAAVAAAGLAACSSGAGDAASPAPSASASPTPDGGSAGPAGGTRMAPGLYDLEDGTVVAVGTVEYRDLEGGFWAVIGGTEAEGDAGKVVAVLTNGDEYAAQFRENAGLSFEIHGERAGEVSIRMAGPRSRPPASRSPARAGPPSSAAASARPLRRAGCSYKDSASRIRWPARGAGATL